MRSPLPAVVDFSAAIPVIKQKVPTAVELNSFLFFDGMIELHMCASNRFVHAHTLRPIIYDFWSSVEHEPQRLVDVIRDIFPFENESMYKNFQDRYLSFDDPVLRAACVFLLSHCSDSPRLSTGSYVPQNFNPIALRAIKDVRMNTLNVRYINAKNFLDLLNEKVSSAFCSIIPVGKFNHNLFDYGKSVGAEETLVNHNDLCEFLKNDKDRWIVVYKYHKMVKKMYNDFNVVMLNRLGREATAEEMCEDLIIANF